MSPSADVSDFAVVAMTRPLDLRGLADHYQVEVPALTMNALERDLREEIASLEISPGASEALSRSMDAGLLVVIGSNLALPYGQALRAKLSDLGLQAESLAGAGRLRAAFSYEMGAIKPHEAFYGQIQQATSLDGACILMVGDKAEEDHFGPVRAGWQAAAAINRTGDPALWAEIPVPSPRP